MLLDAVCYTSCGRVSVGLGESRMAMSLLDQISLVIQDGCTRKLLQKTPHVVLLSRSYYYAKLRPLLAR